MWISMEPLTSITSMLRRAVVSIPALSQKFRQSLAADVPHQSRDRGEQARPPPNNEHAFRFHLRTKLAHGRIRSIHAFDRSRIGWPGTQPSREPHYLGCAPDVYQARVDREIAAVKFM